MIKIELNFVFVMMFVILFFINAKAQPRYGKVVFTDQGISLTVEIAESEAERQQGLMHRQSLAANSAMLFEFEQVGWQRVWMKNTLIHLDIIFISEQGKVVSLLENLPPCYKRPCKIYQTSVPAKYMLEMNAGKIRQLKIKTGQQLVLDVGSN